MAASATPGATMGVEEEFLLTDPATGHTVPYAPRVLRRIEALPPPVPDVRYQAELLTSQIELATGACTSLGELAAQLSAGRIHLAAECSAEDALLVSSGTPVLAGQPPPVSEGLRFMRIARQYAQVVADYQVCGCHVHIGVPDRETAVAVANRVRPWLPALLSLSANSPFHRGTDTGHASWRVVEQSRFPGSGVPPSFPSATAYDRELDRLVDCGALVDPRMNFWLVRPSPRFPTVEFRVADAAGTVEEAVLQAGLSRALVRTCLAELEADRPAPAPRDQVLAAAVWSAARHGVRGAAVDPFLERSVPAAVMVKALLDHVGPQLEQTGDGDLVRGLTAGILSGGSGAERQRAAGRRKSGPRAVVGFLARQTVPGDRHTPLGAVP